MSGGEALGLGGGEGVGGGGICGGAGTRGVRGVGGGAGIGDGEGGRRRAATGRGLAVNDFAEAGVLEEEVLAGGE